MTRMSTTASFIDLRKEYTRFTISIDLYILWILCNYKYITKNYKPSMESLCSLKVFTPLKNSLMRMIK